MEEELKKLREENETLRRLNATKSDWISIAAHQLRTSLAAIKWILKMFLDKDFGAVNTEQEGFLKKAFESTERMTSLVNEMLSLNHTEDATLNFTYTQNDIVELVESTIFDFTGESHSKGIEIVFLKPTEKIAPAQFDVEKIRVVLQNLIENALKYSDHDDKIFISVRINDSKEIEVSVKDTGIGIPPTEKEQIFNKLFRASNAKQRDEIGSGLGLYVTKYIVEKHGGRMWFESEERVGTTFFFTIPLRQ